MKKQIIIAVEVNQKEEDINIGFMVSPTIRSVHDKLDGLRRAVQTGAYKNWSGANRVKFVDQVIARGNFIDFRIFEGQFNGKTRAGTGITLETVVA
tara:strand:+ start:191 stop:478 length:288 start_codon:yes stop_codon:yes gene_type:complete